MQMHSFLTAMIVLVIPSFFVCVLVGVFMYRRWRAETGDGK